MVHGEVCKAQLAYLTAQALLTFSENEQDILDTHNLIKLFTFEVHCAACISCRNNF
jgi:hypothetical protein